jgi:DNA repair exonuclease SbcCD ATPase subunit
MSAEIDILEKRQNRIEDAIERLTDISSDLNKMLAVQDQRLIQQEKNMVDISKTIENRRREWDDKIDAVYNTMREEDKQIIFKIEELRKDQKKQHEELCKKVNDMQRIIWTYMGGFTVLVFLITNGRHVASFFGAM